MGDDNVHIVRGLGALLNPDNVKPGIDLRELERQMISGGIIQNKTRDPQDRFNEELQNAAKELGISFGETPAEQKPANTSPFSRESIALGGSARYGGSPPLGAMRDTHAAHDTYDAHGDEDHGDYSGGQAETDAAPYHSPYPGPQSNLSSSFGSSTSELRARTLEQERRDHINSVIGSDNSLSFSLEKEKLEDQKSSMLAEIDSLMTSLSEENVDISRIPVVSQGSPYDQVESVLRMLRHKSDHIRYSTLFEEFMIFGALGLEELFDGKRTWFGRWRPNAEGWHNNLGLKLKRMRHDTGQLVSGVMQDYNIGSGARILFELVPNFFIYTKMKAQQQQQPDMFTDEDMAQANARLATM